MHTERAIRHKKLKKLKTKTEGITKTLKLQLEKTLLARLAVSVCLHRVSSGRLQQLQTAPSSRWWDVDRPLTHLCFTFNIIIISARHATAWRPGVYLVIIISDAYSPSSGSVMCMLFTRQQEITKCSRLATLVAIETVVKPWFHRYSFLVTSS